MSGERPRGGGVCLHHGVLAWLVPQVDGVCLSLVDDQSLALGVVLAELPVFGGSLANAVELGQVDAEFGHEFAIAGFQGFEPPSG
ncbi:MAG: hypothetical protein ACKOE9_09225 [Vulcanococcus sp.]